MTAPGQPTPYWVLENADGFYYRGYGQTWTTHLHGAAMLSQGLAEQLCRRYPQATVEGQFGYDVYPKEHLADVGEPQAKAFLAEAVKLCKQENWSLETTQVQVEQVYDKVKV